MNRELMLKVRNRIDSLDESFSDMSVWIDGKTLPGRGLPSCGTTACIAGHTIAVEKGTFSKADAFNGIAPSMTAMKLLDIPGRQIFHSNAWPIRFSAMIDRGNDKQAMVAILDAVLAGEVLLKEDCLVDMKVK